MTAQPRGPGDPWLRVLAGRDAPQASRTGGLAALRGKTPRPAGVIDGQDDAGALCTCCQEVRDAR